MLGAHPVGFQIQDLLLEHIFHLPARAIQFLVEPSGFEAGLVRIVSEPGGRQIGHDEPRIIPLCADFSLGDHPPGPSPAFRGLIFKLGKAPRAGGAGQTIPATGVHHRSLCPL